MPFPSPRACALLVLLGLALAPGSAADRGLAAQQPLPGGGAVPLPPLAGAPSGLEGDSAQAVRGRPPGPVTPRSAFLRSLIVPGWGQAAVDAPHRGGFFFLVRSGSAWMITKSHRGFTQARDARSALEDELRSEWSQEGLDAEAIEARLDQDAGVSDARALEDARAQQREDWIALSLFLILLDGVDAFVSAHLWNFPEPIVIEPGPGPGGSLLEIGVRLPLPRR